MSDLSDGDPLFVETLPQFLCAELSQLLSPLTRIAADPAELDALLRTLGAVPSEEQRSGIVSSTFGVAGFVAQMEEIAALPDLSLESVERILALGEQAFDSVRALDASVQASPELAGFGRDVAERLFGNYLANTHPLLRALGVLTTVIEDGAELSPRPVVVRDERILRQAFTLDRFRFERIAQLLRDPLKLFKDEYGESIATAAQASALAEKLFPRLHAVLTQLGFSTRVGVIVADEGATAAAPSLTVLVDDMLLGAEADAGVTVVLSPAEQANLGLVVVPFGALAATRSSSEWQFTLALDATTAFAYGPDGLKLLDDASSASVGATASALLPAAVSGARFVLGSATGTRLEIGSVDFKAGVSFSNEGHTLAFDALTAESAFVIAAADGDGFLADILPEGGLRAEFDFGIGWSNDHGFALHGAASLEADLPVSASLAGLTLSGVHLALRAADDRVETEISATFSLVLGPVYARVDRVGLQGVLTFPTSGGNLGVAQLNAGFKPPTGVGLSVDAQGLLSGGGFLYHDAARALYSGALHLSLHELITLKAFGLISTSGASYSLIIFITAEDFRPVPLGLGFTLLGIGGMIGVNRTFDADAIRQGLKSGGLGALLFPRDPVGNAQTLIRDLDAVFPARQGSYLLGLLAKIGWFTPTLITFDLALILELGARKRLLALGRVSALLPSADNDLVRLNMDAVGVIDFDAGTAAIDAVLLDSRLAHKFPITGSAALRAGFSSGPSFVLAVGGFNPRFSAPAGFPALERAAITLSSGDNPRLVCEAYFAITSNTIQFGARAALYARALGFSVEGDVGFDVLVQLQPLHFIADYHARVQLKRGSYNLFMVDVRGELEGPRPLRVSGRAKFEILWCDFSVRFDTTLVHGELPPDPAGVDVLPQLTAALTSPASWSTLRAGAAPHGVALRSLPPPDPKDPLLLDPLGQIRIQQQLVPLNTARDIELFAGVPVSGAQRFVLTAELHGAALEQVAVQAAFAPAQFFQMSDDEKLAAPSFESMDSGCVFGSASLSMDASRVVASPLEYLPIMVDAPPGMTGTLAEPMLAQSDLQRVNQRPAGRERYRNATATPGATVRPTRWSIVPLGDGPAAQVDPNVLTWSDHQAVLNKLNRGHARWQLVPNYELES